MKDITLTQEFLLCAMNDKGRLPTMDGMCVPTLTAAAMIELLQAGAVQMEDKKAVAAAPLAPTAQHLHEVYDYIAQKDARKLEDIIGHFNFSFSDKAAKGLFADVKQTLADAGCLTQQTVKGLLGEKDVLAPDAGCADAVIQKLRAEVLEDGPMTDEAVALTALFDKARLLKRYFSAYEAEMLQKRLKEIRNDPAYAMIAKMLDYFEGMMVAVIVAAT